MNSNQMQKDLTQYPTACANILGNIFDSINKMYSTQNENEKLAFEKELNENITNFELTLDNCYVDVNESISQIAKGKFEKRMNNNQGELMSLINEEQIPDKDLIDFTVQNISKIKLQVK